MTATLALTGKLEDIHKVLLVLDDSTVRPLTMTLLQDTRNCTRWSLPELECAWRDLDSDTRTALEMMAEKPDRIATSEIRGALSPEGQKYPTPVEHALEPFRERGELLKKFAPGGSTRTYPVDQRDGAYKTDLEFAILVLIVSMGEGT